MPPTVRDVTPLLIAMRDGDSGAREQLLELVMVQLKGIARGLMRSESRGHILQPTALVNECYIHMLAQTSPDWTSRAHFFSVAYQAMRRILVDNARGSRSRKRGGDQKRVNLEDVTLSTEEDPDSLIALDMALTRLEAVDPRAGQVVVMRYFGGLGEEEIAEMLHVSVRTVKRDWRMARAWLRGELNGIAK